MLTENREKGEGKRVSRTRKESGKGENQALGNLVLVCIVKVCFVLFWVLCNSGIIPIPVN